LPPPPQAESAIAKPMIDKIFFMFSLESWLWQTNVAAPVVS
jgi:hypothetical protein